MHCNICMTSAHDTNSCPHRDMYSERAQHNAEVEDGEPKDAEQQRWLEKNKAKNATPPQEAPTLSREERRRRHKEFIIKQQDRLAQQRHNCAFYQLDRKRQENIREQVEKDNPDEEQAEEERQRIARSRLMDRQDLQAKFLFSKFWHQCSDHEQEEVRKSIERCENAKAERC